MGGVTGDNIEGLANFGAFLTVSSATTTTIVAVKTGHTPVVESVVIGMTTTSGIGSIKVQSFDGSAVTDTVECKCSAGEGNMAATRMKLKAVKGDLIRVVSAGTGIAATVHVDGRWISGDANFS